MTELILIGLGVFYGLGYLIFFVSAMLDRDIPKTFKFFGTLLMISLAWPIVFTMYVLSDQEP